MIKLKTLVLEDHPFQRSLAVAALKQCKVDYVLEAANGEQALSLLKAAGGVDVVICDLRMPGMDGLDFLRKAHQLNLIQGVILSSEVDMSLRQGVISMIDFMGLSFLGDLGKPFEKIKLLSFLKQYRRVERVEQHFGHERENLTISEVMKAFSLGEFRAYFQSKIDMSSGRPSGAEVLVRWVHPQRGILSPDHFLAVVESCGRLDELLLNMFTQGCQLQRDLRDCHKSFELSYNLSALQLTSTTLFDNIDDIRASYGISPSSCTFEVTEAGTLIAPVTSLENMIRLRLQGYGLSMDDYGVGFSSLVRLSQLPFNQVKLDKKIVQDLHRKPMNELIIRNTVELVKKLGISLVVEGIESAEQARTIKKLGCDFAQGFYFARPLSSTHLVSSIEQDCFDDELLVHSQWC
ncbi:TPA: EAL domain-containing response regulator [Pseudomonas putida]|nr:EAL domain-containing response regulator [Pseudomonas putida]